MKHSLVYRYRRASKSLPALYYRAALRESPDEPEVRGPSGALVRFASFIAAHSYKFSRLFFGKKGVPMSRELTGHDPDAVRIGTNRYFAKFGVVDEVRVIADEDVTLLDTLESERHRLVVEFDGRIADALESAYQRGFRLRARDVINATPTRKETPDGDSV